MFAKINANKFLTCLFVIAMISPMITANVKRVDIAKKLGLDVSTISRVLNNRQGISEETRNKVLDAVEEHVKHCSVKDSSLRQSAGFFSRGTYKIAVILPAYNACFSEILSGVDKVCYGARAIVQAGTSDYRVHRQKEVLERFVDDGVSGIILWSVGTDIDQIKEVLRPETPLVVLDHVVNHANREIGSVTFDDLAGAGSAVEYLLNLGHRNIGFICPDPVYKNYSTTNNRILACKRALNMRGLDENSLIIGYSHNDDNGYSACVEMFCRENPPSAIFMNDDSMAPHIYSVCRRFGYVVGKDVAVIGFGDQRIASQLEVPLTTVRQNMSLMGEKATEMLLQKVREPLMRLDGVVLNAPLIIRKSCGSLVGNQLDNKQKQ